MHENKFEKQVQEKMDELQLAPSDAVWKNVDNEINKQKKRRRPVFWLFFFFGLLLLGGGYFFVTNNKTKVQESRVQENKIQEEKAQGNKEQVSKKKEVREQAGKKQGAIMQEANNKKSTQTIYADQHSQNIRSILSDKKIKSRSLIKPANEKIVTGEIVNAEKDKSKFPEINTAEEKNNDLIVDDNKETINKSKQNTINKKIIDTSSNKKINAVTENKIYIKDSASESKVAENKKQRKNPSAWKIDFTAHAGISNVNQSLFRSTYVTNSSYYTPATTVSVPGTVTNASSKINPGFSFGADVFLNKSLSKRISFSAGIAYHYYSTKIQTGHFVDSSRNVYSATAAISQANGYYQNDGTNSYTNYYHFIGLPLSINFQLNKNPKMPLVWEAGLSLSYLANSNALQFDPVTNVYYKNNKAFNKFQVNAATAIMLGFHMHKNELQLGPQLQYGLTGLLNKSTANPEHLFYGGLKISFIPRKK